MAYSKQTVIAGDIITATWGNYIQNQYDEAKADVDAHANETVKHVGYAADAEASDTYKIIVLPKPAAYADVVGKIIVFKANTVNTGACTLALQKNDNSWLANVAIKKKTNQDLDDGDILAGSMVIVAYDGTYWQLLSTPGNAGGSNGFEFGLPIF